MLTNDEIVEHVNSCQIFGTLRLVLSRDNDFDFARAVAPSIGTDLYAPSGLTGPGQER